MPREPHWSSRQLRRWRGPCGCASRIRTCESDSGQMDSAFSNHITTGMRHSIDSLRFTPKLPETKCSMKLSRATVRPTGNFQDTITGPGHALTQSIPLDSRPLAPCSTYRLYVERLCTSAPARHSLTC